MMNIKVNNLGSRLTHAMSIKGMSQSDLAREIKVSPQSIQYLCSGKGTKSGHTASIARALNVSAEWLEKGIGDMSPMGLMPWNQMVKSNIPLISWVQAGSWESINDSFQYGAVDEYYPCPEKHSDATFALKVVGESMSPDFIDGEIIFVDPEVEPKNGSCVVVRQNGDSEATFKQLMVDGSDNYLKALNPNWPKKIIEMLPDAIICGVVIGSYRKRN